MFWIVDPGPVTLIVVSPVPMIWPKFCRNAPDMVSGVRPLSRMPEGSIRPISPGFSVRAVVDSVFRTKLGMAGSPGVAARHPGLSAPPCSAPPARAVPDGTAYIDRLVAPPSRRMFWPTMNPACWLHRKAQVAPNSAAVP